MQCLEERDESRRFSGAQIFAICRHVASTLDHLPNQLVLGQPYSHGVESRAAPSALVAERMAVVALLHLKNEGPLPLECRTVVQKLGRNGVTAPCVHDGAPRCMFSEARECP